jgi:hypothetical protein
MQKQIDLMTQILQQNNLGDRILEGAKKKKREDQNPKKGNSSHALIDINSSPEAYIIDLGASHHMASTKEVYYSLDACKGPPILMGDNSLVEVTDKGRIELINRSFKNVFHIPKIFVNLLSMYQMKNYGTRNKFIFTPNVVDIYDMKTNSSFSTSEVNHQSRLYTFSTLAIKLIASPHLVTHSVLVPVLSIGRERRKPPFLYIQLRQRTEG